MLFLDVGFRVTARVGGLGCVGFKCDFAFYLCSPWPASLHSRNQSRWAAYALLNPTTLNPNTLNPQALGTQNSKP